MIRRIKSTIAYDGTEFHGWQIQPGLPTVQGALEQALAELEGEPVHVAGSGRTDAGVHALAQVSAFSIKNPIPIDNLRKAINRLLPPAIRVLALEEAAPDFHPRHQASSKIYEYRIIRTEICSPHEWRYVHHYPYPLDEDAMIRLAPLFEGEHDFSAFGASDETDQPDQCRIRTIFSSEIERSPGRLVYRVRGSGFLKHMVRNMVGTLIEVGKGNLDRAGLEQLLNAAQGKAGPTAPAKGLFLVKVEYFAACS